MVARLAIVLAACLSMLVSPVLAAPVPVSNAKYEPPTVIGQAYSVQKIKEQITLFQADIRGGKDLAVRLGFSFVR